jgi:N-acetylglucosaminyldiphosphoundecaprenol N-acetyl-beta-D-mannosaminyltransferase
MVDSDSDLRPRVRVLDLDFDALTLGSCTDEIMSSALSGDRAWVSTVNVAILMMLRSNPFLSDYTRRSRWVVADGQPIVWLSHLLGRPLPERIGGVDLLDRLCARAEQEEVRVFLIGATEDCIVSASRNLTARYPRLGISFRDGYFSEAQIPEVLESVLASRAKLIFVGMGVPRQEEFIAKHLTSIGPSIAIGVGGSFEVLAGIRRRAPATFQRLGLEWTFRLAQEPRRLLRRYAVTGVQFLALATRSLIRRWVRPGSGR